MNPITVIIASLIMASTFTFSSGLTRRMPPTEPPIPAPKNIKEIPPPAPPTVGTIDVSE